MCTINTIEIFNYFFFAFKTFIFFFVFSIIFRNIIINFVRHVRTGSVASFGLISKTMLRTQMDAIHPHCYPFLIVRFFSLQFLNTECLWVGWYHISSVLALWLWPNQKHKQMQISTGTSDPIPWPHISSLLQPGMKRNEKRFNEMSQFFFGAEWAKQMNFLIPETLCTRLNYETDQKKLSAMSFKILRELFLDRQLLWAAVSSSFCNF